MAHLAFAQASVGLEKSHLEADGCKKSMTNVLAQTLDTARPRTIVQESCEVVDGCQTHSGTQKESEPAQGHGF